MQIRYLFHAQPTELTTTHSTRHVVARAVVHLDDERHALRARLNVLVHVRRLTLG